jgi:plasmid stability protein
MADLLIRDVPAELVAALDAKAVSLGLSRVEFLRRTISREVAISTESVTEQHLAALVELLPDLADEEVMGGAWK